MLGVLEGMGSAPTKSKGSVEIGQIIQKDTTSNPGTHMEKKVSRIILTSGKS